MSIAAGNVQYSYAQLMGVWQQAGGNPQYAGMAAAIAMAESGGNSAAYNVDSNGSIDRGLWQINSVHGAQSSYDVMTNARAAVAISNNGTSWTAWCTAYSDASCGQNGGIYLGQGAPYQQYLKSGVSADTSAPINGTNAAANQQATVGGTNQSPTYLTQAGTYQAYTTGFLGSSCSNPLMTLLQPGLCYTPEVVGGAVKAGENAIATPIIQSVIKAIINPLMSYVAGTFGIGGGMALMIAGLYAMIRQTGPGRAATGLVRAAAAPETATSTLYYSGQRSPTGEPMRARVTQRRRPGVAVGGVQLRRPQVSTESTREVLRGQAWEYAGGEEGRRGPTRIVNTPRGPTTFSRGGAPPR